MKKKAGAKNNNKKIKKKPGKKIEEIMEMLGLFEKEQLENNNSNSRENKKPNKNNLKNEILKVDNSSKTDIKKSNKKNQNNEKKLKNTVNIDLNNNIEKPAVKKFDYNIGNNKDDSDLEDYLKIIDEFNDKNNDKSLDIKVDKSKVNSEELRENEDNLSCYSSFNESLNNDNKDLNEIKTISSLDSPVGLPDHMYFLNIINNNQGSIYFNYKDFVFREVDSDGNCGYRALAVQLYSNQAYHKEIRRDVYQYLRINKTNFNHLTFDDHGHLLNGDEYIEKVKNNKFWMGELEMSVIPFLYDAVLYVFELRANDQLILLSKNGDINNTNKLFLNLCYVNDNHFNILYENKHKDQGKKITKIINMDINAIIKKNMILNNNIKLELTYANGKKKIKYEDIMKFLESKEKTGEGIYPDYINNIDNRKIKKNRKKDFKDSCRNYFIDKSTKRLKIKFYDTTITQKKYKEYYIPYQSEKIQIIKYLHEKTIHKGEKSLYELIKQQDYWWYGIYEDVQNYIKNCKICQQTHKMMGRKPQISQIISKGPRERYVVDLVDIKENLIDKSHSFKYILNIIDHYSKLVGSYLLIKKTSSEVLNHINDFIGHYGEPKILQCDHGKEFDNNLLKNYCKERNINLIFAGVRHPTTNGVVEVVHKDILNSLLSEKLEKKNKFDIKFAISNAARAHNNNIHSVTKYSPEFLFHHNTDELAKEIEKKMKQSQIYRNKDLNPILPQSKVLISSRYIRRGNNLSIKFGKTGKRLIPGIVVGKGTGNNYPISISVDYNDLIHNTIYNIDYRLVKEVTDLVYKNVLDNFEKLMKDLENDSSDNNEDK